MSIFDKGNVDYDYLINSVRQHSLEPSGVVIELTESKIHTSANKENTAVLAKTKNEVFIVKIKIFLFLLICGLMNMQICLAGVIQDDFTVKGVNLFSSRYEDVIAKLGKPHKEKVEEEGKPAYTYLTYPGLSIWTVNETKGIVYMRIEGYDQQTKRGLKVGATTQKIIKEYGQPQKQNIHGHMYYVYPITGEVNGRLLFDMTDGYAGQIIFTAVPNLP